MQNFSAAQRRIQNLVDDLTERDIERGIQIAAYLDGELVIDACSGVADPATGRKVNGDTLFPVFSTGKGISATAIHILAEQKKLDYDTPIAECWPEFAQYGKENITLRQALCHVAGIPQLPKATIEELCDWNEMCRKTAELQPLWPPGSKTFYHAISFSWIIGETARRLDGRDFNTIVQEEICRPLGIDSLFLGIPAGAEAKVAVLDVPPPDKPSPIADDPLVMLSIPPEVRPLEAFMNIPEIQRACIPATNGIMSAQAIARHYAALVSDVDGIRLLSPEALRHATTLNAPVDTPVSELPNKFGLGYILSGPEAHRGQIFGHGGYGGAGGVADVKHKLAIGITKNRLHTASPDLNAEVYAALGL